jgi:hypothetical protein
MAESQCPGLVAKYLVNTSQCKWRGIYITMRYVSIHFYNRALPLEDFGAQWSRTMEIIVLYAGA